jgi:CheY-like chemotaxis protein
LPPLLEPLGVTAVKAQSARQAERLIRSTTIHIAVVDLTLPLDDGPATEAEEAGTRVLDILSRLESPPPTVVVQSPRGQRDAKRCLHTALRCGAFAVVDRTAADLELMLGIMQRCLARFYGNQWPGRAAPPNSLSPPTSGIY